MANRGGLFQCGWSLARALLHCWPILLVPSLLTALAVGTEQGRDAIAATASRLTEVGPGYHAYAAQTVSTVMATLAALVLLAPRRGLTPCDSFAAYFVPALIGLLTGYLPLIALEWGGFDGFTTNPWLELSRAIPPVLVIAARDGMWLVVRAHKQAWSHSKLESAKLLDRPRLRQLAKPIRVLVSGVIYFLFSSWFMTVAAVKRLTRLPGELRSQVTRIRFVVYVAILLFFVSAFFVQSATTLAIMALGVFVIGDIALYPTEQPEILQERRWLLCGCALFAVGGGLWVAYDPTGWGLGIGSYATLMVVLNTWLGAGILIWQLQISTVFVVVLIALVLSGPFGLGDIRVIPDKTLQGPNASLEAYARDWLKSRRVEIDRVKSPDRYPIFLVNADGGGVRAAWWSATLLALIADHAPRFPKHVFAMSGASGGSLGIAVFALQQVEEVDGTERNNPCVRGQRQRCTADLLSADLLAPTVAAMLTVDLTRSIVEHSIWPEFSRMSFSADRATALEHALEQVWMDHTGSRLFEEPFTRLWGGKRRLEVPVLLMNTSDVTGRRLVIAPVTTGENTTDRGDLLPLLGTNDLRLSTAVVLSARFPGVTPAGWIKTSNAEQGYAIVDGGYADNSGAHSASEAHAALRKAASAEGIADKIQVVAIMIANDPISAQPAPAVPLPSVRSEVSTLGSLIAPVMTLDRLRQTNTQEAKRTYAKEVSGGGGLVLDHFDLKSGKMAFPLGWMLASTTRTAMEEQQKTMLSDSESHLCRAIRLARATADLTRANDAMACVTTK